MMTKHKVFISFYHKDDQKYKNYISTYLCGNIIDKSVESGEYDSDLSDEYIKRLIREDKISDSSVIVVLIGPNTYKRKHVDWETILNRDIAQSILGNMLLTILMKSLKKLLMIELNCRIKLIIHVFKCREIFCRK